MTRPDTAAQYRTAEVLTIASDVCGYRVGLQDEDVFQVLQTCPSLPIAQAEAKRIEADVWFEVDQLMRRIRA